jgi:hypothetical protein
MPAVGPGVTGHGSLSVSNENRKSVTNAGLRMREATVTKIRTSPASSAERKYAPKRFKDRPAAGA